MAAFSKAYYYQDLLPDGSANPETKAQFMRRCIMDFIRNTVQGVEVGEAAEAARAAEMAKAIVSVS